ncbi:MAG: hypothetical protein WBC78_21730, partial [Candidatus Sulfotelmatobacter sp.]
MTSIRVSALVFCVFVFCASAAAQNVQPAAVPTLIKFSGNVKDANGKPLSGIAGLTFALYQDQQGGAPLWLETQNVQLDASGHYAVRLGATKPDGMPIDIFASGEARWLGVQVEGQSEQPRVLLLSVPYALKSADADTVGGLPPSAFVRTDSGGGIPEGDPTSRTIHDSATKAQPQASATVTTSGGTTNFVPLWTGGTTIGNSALFQAGADIGIGTENPGNLLHVSGGKIISQGTNGSYGLAQLVNTKVGEATLVQAAGVSGGIGGTLISLSNNYIWASGPGSYGTTPDHFNIGSNGVAGGVAVSVLAPSGNVGIATTTPGATLDVNGRGR